jgi:hypothetical protein
MKASIANRLWLATSRRAAKDFQNASHNVAETQNRILQGYLAKNKTTSYLSNHSPLSTFHLPLTTYDDYIPYIERITNGEKNVLTAEPVQLFELSGGSTSASKMIPYTRTLKREFGCALSSWITDLYTHHPDLVTGPAYWSISPLTEGRRYTAAGIPIGFEEDSEYLGSLGILIESALAVPNLVKHIHDVSAFRYVTLLFLLHCADLRLISVWNPTFLTLLLQPLPQWWDSLLQDIANGTITPPVQLDDSLLKSLARKLRSNPQRVRLLSKLKSDDYRYIWPGLKLISCWADGASSMYAHDLQEKFPDILIQPKGLLATEAFVSFPVTGRDGAALAVTSHYFEFLADSGDVLLAHELEKGRTYSVVVTTGGGLYRYQLNDIVEVTDFYNHIPCFRFVGKADKVSDYFGEKLSEQFVANVLENLFAKNNLSPMFFMLAPDDTDMFHYTLYLELGRTVAMPNHLNAELDSALCENFHYDYCRRLGQLNEVQTVLVKNGSEAYIQACQMRGMKMGDVKASVLQKSTGWNDWFQPVRKEAVSS